MKGEVFPLGRVWAILIKMNEYTVLLTWDDEAQVWIALNDDIPIALNSSSLDELMERVRRAVPEMLEMNGKPHEGIPLHFKANRVVVAA